MLYIFAVYIYISYAFRMRYTCNSYEKFFEKKSIFNVYMRVYICIVL